MSNLVSIVIPAYNEAENITKICETINQIFEPIPYQYEILIIIDGATDNSIEIIEELRKTNNRIFYIEFSRNFGHQLALKAGLDFADGDCVISMDCDMQHPPELLPLLLDKWKEGYEVVYTLRKDDKRLSFWKRFSSKLYYKTINSLSDVELDAGSADFRLIDRKVVEAFRKFNENEPFLRGLLKWIGFKQYALSYEPASRYAGSTKYSFKKMTRLALQGVTSFSIKPLYIAVYLGFAFSMASVLYIPYILHAYYYGQEVSGWASLIMTVVFFGGLQLIILGITGIYIGKMFLQSKNRPNYIIRSTNIKN